MLRQHLRLILIILVAAFFVAGCSKGPDEKIDDLVKKAIGHLKQDEFGKAQNVFKEAVEMAEQEFGPDHPMTVKPLQGLGAVYHARKDYSKAVQTYQRILRIVQEKGGEENIFVSQVLNNLGGVYFDQKNYEKALSTFEKSLAIAEANFSGDNLKVQKLRKNIETCKNFISGKQKPGKMAKNGPDTNKMGQIASAGSPAQSGSDSSEVRDYLPEKVKDAALKQLAEKDIYLYNLQPMEPVKIGSQGAVLPYRCEQKMEKQDEKGRDVVLLFATVSNEDKPGSYTFKRCRMVTYESYMEELESNPAELVKSLREVFSRVY
ncbi:MAG: tetratricopeptide repeat protein [Desulfobacterales bacterium]|nr:tetratricopeptide repeat protein [Desulfobacterales bacterium]